MHNLFRSIVAVFVRDEQAFFTSTDIQRLKIDTILTSGHLIPPRELKQLALEHHHTQISISCSANIDRNFFAEFFSLFSLEEDRKVDGLIFELRVKAPEFWQAKMRFLMSGTQEKALEEWLQKKNFAVRKKKLVSHFCLPERGGEVWRRCHEGLQDKHGMVPIGAAMQTMMEFPSLSEDPCKYAYKSFDIPPNCAVLSTIDCFAFPPPPVSPPVIGIILNAMEEVIGNDSMTTYQAFMKDTISLREMDSIDLPAVILSAVLQNYTPP